MTELYYNTFMNYVIIPSPCLGLWSQQLGLKANNLQIGGPNDGNPMRHAHTEIKGRGEIERDA